MSDIILGLAPEPDACRDAIHIAVAPVSSNETLQPGQRVSLVEGSTDKVCSSPKNSVGIVDPYLRGPVMAGSRFWLCLYCKTVTSLRHEWTHPAFKAGVKPVSESEEWVRQFCDEEGLHYDEVIRAYENNDHVNTGDNQINASVELGDHLAKITGKQSSPRFGFSCAC